MHVETLDARTLFAAAGIDASFGDDGTLSLGNLTSTTVGSSLAITGGTFVEILKIPGGRYIYRFDESGKLDTAWGNGGRTKVNFDVQQLAYDKRTGYLYAAGAEGVKNDPIDVLMLIRLNANGQMDPSYGTIGNGTATYRSAIPDGKTSIHASVSRVIPLPGREVLVAFDRSASITRSEGGSINTVATDEIALIKFRNNGTRDIRFGQRGVTTIYETNTSAQQTPEFRDRFFGRLTLGDVQPLAGGAFRVVYSLEEGADRLYNVSDSLIITNASFEMKSRTLSPAGALDPEAAHSWLIRRREDGRGMLVNDKSFENSFKAKNVAIDVDGNINLVGAAGDGAKIGADIAYRLSPGIRPRVLLFGGPSLAFSFEHVARNARGTYFGAERDGTTVRLGNGFALQKEFATNGILELARTNIRGLIADAEGGALVIGDNTITRVK